MNIIPTLHEAIIGPTAANNPRNGEGDIVALRDGRLLLGWTRFTGGGHDHSTADIAGRFSTDGGRTWGAPFTLQENVGECNVMSVSFLRLASGALLFGFAIKNHERYDCLYYVRRSDDDGQTWSAPVLATPESGYMVANNARLLQTSDGRVFAPIAKGVDPDYHGLAACFVSADEGRSWQRSSDYVDLAGPVGADEAGVVECADGSLWLYVRTDKGAVYACRSTDGGASWSALAATELVAPISPATARRLPGSDDILIIYNDRRGVPFSSEWRSEFNHRTPLVAAISHDHGQTWQAHKLVEADRTKSYCYTSITFHNDETLLTYYVGQAGGPNLLDLKLKIVPTAAWTA